MTTESHTQSYYAATANPSKPRPELLGDAQCDICVIGAGFTGLSTALHLVEKGYQVIVLEAAKIAWGASGRNGGQVVNGFNRDLDGIAKRYGDTAALAIGDMCFEGANIIRERIQKYQIQCDYKKGNLFCALSGKQLKDLERRKLRWEQHGHQGLEWIPADKIKQFVNTDLYCGGLLDTSGGHLHPMNLALGEADAIESLGGKVYEHSRVIQIDRGKKVVVRTTRGTVNADYLVACGNAYLGDLLPQIETRVLPASSQVTATEVLSEKLTRELLPHDHCVEDMGYFLDYYRITGDNRLLFGGGTIYGGKDPSDIRAELRPHILKTFPQLKSIKIEYAWSGNMGLTVSRIPHMGRLDDNIYFSHGYSGHGVTGSHMAGRLVAESISAQSNRFDVFGKLSHVPFPGGKHLRVPITVAASWYFSLREKLGI